MAILKPSPYCYVSGNFSRDTTRTYGTAAGIDASSESAIVHRVQVHRFKIGDVDDPDIFAGEKLWEWQNSEAGQWFMENSTTVPQWHRQIDISSYCYDYVITATLSDRAYVYYCLRWK